MSAFQKQKDPDLRSGPFRNFQKQKLPFSRRRIPTPAARPSKCPKLYGAQTAGELQKVLRRRGIERNLTQCYLILCGLPCNAHPCCRPDYEVRS
jgi:hypothetical protein